MRSSVAGITSQQSHKPIALLDANNLEVVNVDKIEAWCTALKGWESQSSSIFNRHSLSDAAKEIISTWWRTKPPDNMARLYPHQEDLVKLWLDTDIVSTAPFTKWLLTRAMQMSRHLEEARAVYDTDESFKEHIRLHPILFDACQLVDFFAISYE